MSKTVDAKEALQKMDEMDDDAFLNADPEALGVDPELGTDPNLMEIDPDEPGDPNDPDNDVPSPSQNNDESTDSDKDKEEDPDKGEDTPPATDDKFNADDPPTKDPDTEDNTDPDKDKEPETPATNDVDHKSFYEEITAPFTANGTEIQVRTPEEARRLMQMGANYHKKMAGLKPNRKILRLLDNNGVLSEDKINYLIDLNNHKPEAITQLLKDSKIDVMDLDIEGDKTYTPEKRTVSDKELNLEDSLDSIKDTPEYSKTLNVIDNWDQPSQSFVSDNPVVLETINAHMADGTYDIVEKERARLEVLGEIPKELNSVQVYQWVGQKLVDEGTLEGAQPSAPEKPPSTPPAPKNDADTKAEEDKREKKRKAAGITSGASAKTPGPDPDFDPLSLSDDEFEKFDQKLFTN